MNLNQVLRQESREARTSHIRLIPQRSFAKQEINRFRNLSNSVIIMKKILFSILMGTSVITATHAQESIYPAPAQTQTIALTNAIVHVGNGQVIENGMVVISGGKIVDVRPSAAITDVKVIDCKGKHLYPGLILSNSQLGLVEVPSIRATNDSREIGEVNSNIRSIVAYNTDSKVPFTLRNTGILMANVVPLGGVISGTSSVVQLDAWYWEDAAVATDNRSEEHTSELQSPCNLVCRLL